MAKIIDNRTSPSGEPVFSTFLHSKGRSLGIPISGTFELTPRCNFNCKMCYIHSCDCNLLADKEISADKWISLGERVRDAGTVFLLLTGGEPLVRKDFPLIYREISKMGFVLSLNTNASLITDEYIELFRENVPHRVNISLYGASEETYESLCGMRQFENVITNIRKLKEAGIQVKINSSITPYNCGDMERIFQISKELGVNVKMATYLYPPMRNSEDNKGVNTGRFSPLEAAEYKLKYERLKSDKGEFLKKWDNLQKGLSVTENECFEPDEEGDGLHCRAGKTSYWIDWCGNMSHCGIIPSNKNNVFEKDFSQCWKNVRENAEKIRLPRECKDCKYKSVCPSCGASCLCETGVYDKRPEYLCEYSREFAKLMKTEAERIKGE